MPAAETPEPVRLRIRMCVAQLSFDAEGPAREVREAFGLYVGTVANVIGANSEAIKAALQTAMLNASEGKVAH